MQLIIRDLIYRSPLNIEGVTFSGGVPELVNNKTYQISIMNNLAVIAQF